MSFIDHLEALRWHLVRSVVAVVVGAILIFIYAKEVVSIIVLGPARNDFISYSVLCNLGRKLHLGDVLCMGNFTIKFQKGFQQGSCWNAYAFEQSFQELMCENSGFRG